MNGTNTSRLLTVVGDGLLTVAGDGLLTVVGDLVTDIVVRPRGAVRHGTDNPAAIRHTRGGSAANVAAAAAGLIPTRFIGRVGDDIAGERLAAELGACGVDVRLQRAGRTGSVVVVVDDDGERTMYPDRAAAGELAEIEPSWLERTKVLHLPAYGLSTSPMAAALQAAARTVHADGGSITVDVSAESLVDELSRDAFDAVLEELRPAIVFANAAEAAKLDLRDRRPKPDCIYVIKAGADPATIVTGDGPPEQVAPSPVDAVGDTTGAGDAFAAGFLAAWMHGEAAADAAAAGHATAAKTLAGRSREAGSRCTPT